MNKELKQKLADLFGKSYTKELANGLILACRNQVKQTGKEEFASQIRFFLAGLFHDAMRRQNYKVCFSILDFCLDASGTPQTEVLPITLPLKFLNLLFNFSHISKLPKVLDFCLRRREYFERIAIQAVMNFLATFNSLARRLSTEEATLGKLLKFMSDCLGPSSRSNLNISGVINQAIHTVCEKDVDAGSDVNQELYHQLWATIDICQVPSRMQQHGHMKWQTFKKNVEEIIKAFKVEKLDPKAAKVLHKESIDPNFDFPKYVTSSRLFNYQLNDPNFRRHVLLQIGICVLGHLQYAKCDLPPLRQQSPLLRTMTNADHKWIAHMYKELLTILEQIPFFVENSKGELVNSPKKAKELSASLSSLLRREYHYVHWKHDRKSKARACPSFVKKPQQPVDGFKFPSMENETYGKRCNMGTASLEKLWRYTGEKVDVLKEEGTKPDFKEFLRKDISGLIADETDTFLSEKERRRNDTKFCFHTMRALVRERPLSMKELGPHYFTLANNSTNVKLNNPMLHLLCAENEELGKKAMDLATKPSKKTAPKKDSAKSTSVKKTELSKKPAKKRVAKIVKAATVSLKSKKSTKKKEEKKSSKEASKKRKVASSAVDDREVKRRRQALKGVSLSDL